MSTRKIARLKRMLAESEAEIARILARPVPVVEDKAVAFDQGYEQVMSEHKRGRPLDQLHRIITRMDATNRWPDFVRGSWVAYHQLRGI